MLPLNFLGEWPLRAPLELRFSLIYFVYIGDFSFGGNRAEEKYFYKILQFVFFKIKNLVKNLFIFFDVLIEKNLLLFFSQFEKME